MIGVLLCQKKLNNEHEYQELYDVGGGRCFPIIGYVSTKVCDNGAMVDKDYPGAVPLLNIKMMSDFKWQYGCLMSRLESPENYKNIDTDVSATIEGLKQWLREHIDCISDLKPEEQKLLLDILKN